MSKVQILVSKNMNDSFQTKMLSIGGSKVQLQVWDTAGQERFQNLSRSYYKDVHGED